MSSHVKWLFQAADEIRARGFSGWGNTCEDAARYISGLEAQLAAARETIEYALKHSHEENHLRILHWDAYEKLQATAQEVERCITKSR